MPNQELYDNHRNDWTTDEADALRIFVAGEGFHGTKPPEKVDGPLLMRLMRYSPHELLANLTPRERDIIWMRSRGYANPEERMTLEEIGAELAEPVQRERVRQIVRKVKPTLRVALVGLEASDETLTAEDKIDWPLKALAHFAEVGYGYRRSGPANKALYPMQLKGVQTVEELLAIKTRSDLVDAVGPMFGRYQSPENIDNLIAAMQEEGFETPDGWLEDS